MDGKCSLASNHFHVQTQHIGSSPHLGIAQLAFPLNMCKGRLRLPALDGSQRIKELSFTKDRGGQAERMLLAFAGRQYRWEITLRDFVRRVTTVNVPQPHDSIKRKAGSSGDVSSIGGNIETMKTHPVVAVDNTD